MSMHARAANEIRGHGDSSEYVALSDCWTYLGHPHACLAAIGAVLPGAGHERDHEL
jgi:hypothetical protein